VITGSAVVIATSPAGWLLLASTAVSFVVSILIDRDRRSTVRGPRGRVLLVAGVAANALVFALARAQMDGRTFMFSGVPVVTCLAVALLIDVFTG